jgi:hypothetical protein
MMRPDFEVKLEWCRPLLGVAPWEHANAEPLFADVRPDHQSRTPLGLQKDAPEPRPVQGPELGRIVALPQVGGPHHRYERRAA